MLECISHALCAVLAEQTLHAEMDLPCFCFSFSSYKSHHTLKLGSMPSAVTFEQNICVYLTRLSHWCTAAKSIWFSEPS